MLKRTRILTTKKSTLEGMPCDRYSLQSGQEPIEAWVHTDTWFPIQLISRISDSVIFIQRFTWLSWHDVGECILPTGMTFAMFHLYSKKLNQKIKGVNLAMQLTAPQATPAASR
jgi:hypothetical protein